MLFKYLIKHLINIFTTFKYFYWNMTSRNKISRISVNNKILLIYIDFDLSGNKKKKIENIDVESSVKLIM